MIFCKSMPLVNRFGPLNARGPFDTSGRIAVALATVASVILSFEGAAKTSAYYSIAPFLGVAFGMLILGERPALVLYCPGCDDRQHVFYDSGHHRIAAYP